MVEGRTHRPVVEQDACQTCKVCIRGCPAEFIDEYRKEEKTVRGALYSGQIARTRRREKSGLPPCQEACPVHLKTDRYVHLIAEGRFFDALDVIREELPFPGIIGRICHHPCENVCLRGKKLDEPVSLCALKGFVADYEVGKRDIPIPAVGDHKSGKVAVIGGGPSGMACALDLRKAGYAVTIFEASDRLGGMLYWGIPAYRLPRDVITREVSLVEKAGIDVRYTTTVGRDISLKEIHKGFDAIYLGSGAQSGAKLGLPHEDAAGIASGIDFLRRANENRPMETGSRVVVVGGGNVAVDAALTAKRFGAKEVRIVCLEKRSEMAAAEWEVEQTRDEHVKVLNGWGPKQFIVPDGRTKGIELKRCISVFDKEGRFQPAYNEKITKTLDADTIIVAIGQAAEADFLRSLPGLELTETGWVKADQATLVTSVAGIFAGGDLVSGPGSAIDAIADGKNAAISIDRYLSKTGSAVRSDAA